jgi:exosome complex RNA-binding protein Rrp42 (RNase PH superfamily)
MFNCSSDKSTSLDVVSTSVPVSVGIFEQGVYLVDPAQSEEKVLQGLVTCVVDTSDGSLRYLRQVDEMI